MLRAAEPAPNTRSHTLQRLVDVELLPFVVGCRQFETGIGRIVLHPALPILYDNNFVQLKKLPDVPSSRLIATLESRVRPAFEAVGATHLRFVAVRDLVLPLRQPFVDAGYRHTGFAILQHRRPAVRRPEPRVQVRPVRSPLDEAAFNLVDSDVLSEVPWGTDLIRAALRVRRNEVQEALDLTWYVATLDGQTAGSIGLLKTGMNASIQEVSTRPAFRRKSVATTMVLEMVAEARADGRHEISLMSEEDSPALGLYLDLGFVVAGYVDAFVKDE